MQSQYSNLYSAVDNFDELPIQLSVIGKWFYVCDKPRIFSTVVNEK